MTRQLGSPRDGERRDTDWPASTSRTKLLLLVVCAVPVLAAVDAAWLCNQFGTWQPYLRIWSLFAGGPIGWVVRFPSTPSDRIIAVVVVLTFVAPAVALVVLRRRWWLAMTCVGLVLWWFTMHAAIRAIW